MDFIDRINQLATSAKTQQSKMLTEEATKNALVMPFIQTLGYNPFDLNEVHPEFIADVGVKKGEKVDYAIMQDGTPILLFECKMAGTDLADAHASQLYRYFSVTDARFAVLTNGTEYWFFTDLDAPNKMDTKPFLKFSLLDLRDTVIEELKKFTKEAFDVDEILSTATQLKYTNEIKQIISNQLTDPDEDLVKFFASHVHSGKVVTAAVRDQFTKLTRLAFRQFINDQITDRLKSALEGAGDALLTETEDEEGNKVETTLEEHEGYLIVRAILREVVDGSRVIMRDKQSYCGILLDDNNRKPLCRLHFGSKQKYIGLFDADKNEERVPIEGIEDIYNYADRLRITVGYYS
jgi:hypothetical protein